MKPKNTIPLQDGIMEINNEHKLFLTLNIELAKERFKKRRTEKRKTLTALEKRKGSVIKSMRSDARLYAEIAKKAYGKFSKDGGVL